MIESKADKRRKISEAIQDDARKIVALARVNSILSISENVEQLLYARSIGMRSRMKICRLVGILPDTFEKLLTRGEQEYRNTIERGAADTSASLFYKAWHKHQAVAIATSLEKFNDAVDMSDDWRAHKEKVRMLDPESYTYDPSAPFNKVPQLNVNIVQVIQKVSEMSTAELAESLAELQKFLPSKKDHIQDAELEEE